MKIGIVIIVVCAIVMAGLFIRLVHNEKKIDNMTDKAQKGE